MIAQRILAWPGDEAPGGSEVIAACETIIRATAARAGEGDASGLAGRRDLAAANGTRGPLGGAPSETTPSSESSSGSGGSDAAAIGPRPVPDVVLRPLVAPSADHPPRSLPKPWESSDEPSDGDEGPASIANRPARLFPVRRLAVGDSAEAADPTASPETAAKAAAAAREEIFAAIRRLRDPAEAAEAETYLRRRGLTDRHLALARQLLDPDPAVRRRLARQLPEVPGLDAAAWLVLLSRDTDAEVRLTALTLLATTGDPTLLDEVGEAVRNDGDPRVQRLAERLAPGMR